MAVTQWLIDKSALSRLRLGQARDTDVWAGRIDRGLVRIASVTKLEMGYSARTGAEAREIFTSPPLALMPTEYLTPSSEDRAIEVQALLAERGLHRAPSIPDLLIAALAEQAGLTVLAVDKDFDLIAEVTGQPVETLELL